MISLPELIALNNRPPVRRDNFNRDSSFVQSKAGFVIHSGIHRSTAFVSKEDHADCWFAFSYWSKQGQAAVNAFIEAIIDGGTLDTAEENAFRKSRPGWKVRKAVPKQRFAGGFELVATRGEPLPEIQAASTWRHLHARTERGEA